MSNILIAGCGYVGGTLGLRLHKAGHRVWGLRRFVDHLPAEIQPFSADLTAPETLRPMPVFFDYVFYTAGAMGYTEDAYRAAYVEGLWNLCEALQTEGQRPERLFFTSSTGVYAQDQGELLDETSPVEPRKFSGQCLLEGETLLLDCAIPATIVRLGGIYGPGRTRLIETVRDGSARCLAQDSPILNLIHRDDCAGVLYHLMHLDAPHNLYLAVDNEPIEKCALLRWIAKEMKVPMPPIVDEAEYPKSIWGGNRKFNNARLLATGYRFAYPTFRDGYKELL